MKKYLIKTVAVFVVLSMMMSLVSCSFFTTKNNKTGHLVTKEKKEEPEETEETEETKEIVETTETTAPDVDVDVSSNEIEFNIQALPEEPYSYDKVHPYHTPGSVTGDEAAELLSSIENEIIQEELSCYVDATLMLENYEAFGITYDDISIGEVSLDEVTEEDMTDTIARLEALYSIDYESLEENDRLFYDKLVFDLEETVYYSQFTEYDYMIPVFNSFTSVQCDILFVLDIMEFKTTEDVENYLLVLQSIEPYFGDLCTIEERRAEKGYAQSDSNYEGIAVSFDNLVAQKEDCFLYQSFETRLDAVDGLTDAEKADFISRHETIMKDTVFATFENCASRMRALKGNCVNELGLCYYEGGTELYAAVVRSKSNSQITPEESIEATDKILKDLYQLLISGRAVLNYDFSKGDVQDNLDFLYSEIFKYFPEVPEHEYQLREVPEVFSESFSPAAYLGYHLDNYDSNLILINTASESDSFGTVVAHEGYPGHMYQSLYTRTVATHPYMYLNGSIGYKEGWAQYVELFSTDLFDGTEKEKNGCYLSTMLNLYIMARIDLGVNYEGWNCDDAVEYLNDVFGMNIFSSAAIQQIFDICVADPGYPLPYALGYYNTNNILSEAFEQHPDLSSKEIFAAYLDAQTGTFEQIDAYVDKRLG